MNNLVPDWLDVSRETFTRLEQFTAQALRWNAAINLVSKSTVPMIWQRHIWDSAQLFALGNPAETWLDIGSGGGFPGIVLAIMGAQKMVLVESDQRKAAFLREMARQFSLPVVVHAKRIDQIGPLNAKTVSARALASLTDLLAHATPHLAQDGVAVFPKGRGFDAEIEAAQTKWRFDVETYPSKTDENAAVLVIKNTRHQ